MNDFTKHSGWFVAAWGWVVANLPSASDCLVIVSIFVGIAQLVYTCLKIRGKR